MIRETPANPTTEWGNTAGSESAEWWPVGVLIIVLPAQEFRRENSSNCARWIRPWANPPQPPATPQGDTRVDQCSSSQRDCWHGWGAASRTRSWGESVP